MFELASLAIVPVDENAKKIYAASCIIGMQGL